MNILYLLGGVITLIIGVYIGLDLIKNPTPQADDPNQYNLKGTLYAIILIIGGVLLLIKGFGIVL